MGIPSPPDDVVDARELLSHQNVVADLDLLDRIKGLYRLLDLYSENGSEGYGTS